MLFFVEQFPNIILFIRNWSLQPYDPRLYTACQQSDADVQIYETSHPIMIPYLKGEM